MDSKFNYISKMEQGQQSPNATETDYKKVIFEIPSNEDFLKELNKELLSISTLQQVDDNLREKTERAFLIAAFSGKFSPNRIVADENETDKNLIINTLFPYCNIETTESKVFWMLKADKRKAVLSDFISIAQPSDDFIKEMPSTDEFGLLLRQIILQNDNLPIENMNRNQLVLLSSVLESIEGLNIKKPDIALVKNLLDLKSFIYNYNHLTETFVGRKKELESIRTFINKPNQWSWDALVLKGVGGVGKSTLLAKICTEILDEKFATLILIDFDRPGMSPQDTEWLENELLRQVGIQFPKESENLKKRSEANQYLQEDFSSSRSNVLESMQYEKISRRNLIAVQQIIHNTGKPLVIVFDTIEEVFQQKSFEKLQKWIEIIYEIFIPIPIKVIFSGRIQDELDVKNNEYQTILLDAFDKATARVFLEKLGNKPETIKSILKTAKIPLRPLELKLITKILKDQNITFEILEKEIFAGKESTVSQDFYTGMIYRRVLNRIQNPVVKKVAYPGLILRYITSDLLQVLSPLLGLPDMNQIEKEDVLSDLESYGWLSYRLNGTEIWHRKDLRRIMIRMIMEQQPELTLSIRNAAISYFDSQNDSRSKAESLYHQLMIRGEKSDLEVYKLSALKSAAEFIGSDDFDLPKPAAVTLQFANTGKVTTADIEFLPDLYFKKIYEKTGRKFVNRQQFNEAYKLYFRAQSIDFQITASGIGLGDRWEQEMLFNLGKFEEIRHLKSYQKCPTEMSHLLQLLHYIFPVILIAPDDIDIEKVEDLLMKACSNVKYLEKILSGPDSLTIITRLSYALAIINDLYGLSKSMVLDIQKIVNILKLNYKFGNADRSRLILYVLATSQIPESYQMSLSNLKLEPEWLMNIQNHVTESMQTLIAATLSIFNQTTNNPMPARSFLNHIDSMDDIRNGWYKINVNLQGLNQETVYKIVRGTNTTFRNGATAAIYDMLQSGLLTNENLRVILFDTICTNINDLQANVFEKMIMRKVDWLEPLIELIDREGSLVSFVDRLYSEIPNSRQILQVNDALQRWEKALVLLLKAPTVSSSL